MWCQENVFFCSGKCRGRHIPASQQKSETKTKQEGHSVSCCSSSVLFVQVTVWVGHDPSEIQSVLTYHWKVNLQVCRKRERETDTGRDTERDRYYNHFDALTVNEGLNVFAQSENIQTCICPPALHLFMHVLEVIAVELQTHFFLLVHWYNSLKHFAQECGDIA